MKVAVGLQAGRKVVEDHEITQGAYARDENGNRVDYMSPNAVCFCTLGSLYRGIMTIDELDRRFDMICETNSALESALPEAYSNIPMWNDSGRSKAEILDLYDRAIELVGDKEIEG